MYTYVHTYTHIYMYEILLSQVKSWSQIFWPKIILQKYYKKNYKKVATILQKCYLLESILTT